MSVFLSDKTKEIYDEFKLSLKIEKTRKEYLYVIESFCDFVKKDYLDANFADYMAYCNDLDQKQKAGRYQYKTLCFKHSVLHIFSTYIVNNSERFGVKNFQNYMIRITKPVADITIRPASLPTPEELDKIYSVASSDPMMYAVIAMVNKCGLTTEQVSSLRRNNIIIDANQNVGMVFPYEYRSNRYIKIPDDLINILGDWMNKRTDDSDYMFVNSKGGKISGRSLQLRTKHIMEKAFGTDGKSYSLQDLRNLSAVLMIKGGAEKDTVADYLGINAKWIQRYGKAVEQYTDAPCDLIHLSFAANQ